jgi:hypothetical protein
MQSEAFGTSSMGNRDLVHARLGLLRVTLHI